MTLPTTTPSTARLERLLSYIERDATNLKLRKDAVREAIDTGQWGTARELIDAGLQAEPAEADLLALSGFAYLQAQHYGDAEQALLAALARGVNAPDLRYNIAFADFMQRRYAEALEWLTPPDVAQALPLALTLRARCLHHLGRPLEAIADCKARLIATPDDADTLGLVALLLYEQRQSDDAMENLKAALRQNPRQLEAMLALASIQADAQDPEAASASFQSLLQAHPQCGRGWLGLALLKLGRMRPDEARHDIEFAAEHLPEHIGTWHVLAWVQIMQGDVAGAEQAFERALVLDRNFGETHGGLAVIAALQGREDDAREGIRRALRLNPQGLSAHHAELLLLKRHGRDAEAKALVESVLEQPTPQGDMRYRDLVAVHMKYLEAQAAQPSGGVVLH